jgi:hypothetical protein
MDIPLDAYDAELVHHCLLHLQVRLAAWLDT